jgi:hypothetical protein
VSADPFARPRIQQLHAWIVAEVPCQKPAYRSHLKALPLRGALVAYLNWRDRFITPRARRVMYLNGFWESDTAWRFRDKIQEIERLVALGADMEPYLSTRVHERGFAPSMTHSNGQLQDSKWRDKDFALNAYSMHHLHLQKNKKADELLFAEFGRSTATFVMLGTHATFDSEELEMKMLLARAKSDQFVLKGVRGPVGGGYTAAERNELARAGISTMTSIDGNVVLGAMVATSAHSNFTSSQSGQICSALRDLDVKIDDRRWVVDLFENANRELPENADFRWQLADGNLLLIETSSRTAFSIVVGRQGLPTELSIAI